MSILKHIFFTVMMEAGPTAAAQEDYDITEQHLQNAAFDTDFK